jgi:hypothetical protein
MTHENAKPIDYCGSLATAPFGNRRAPLRRRTAKSGNTAFVSWDPYPGRYTAKPSRQSARSACSASGKLPLAIDLRPARAILGAITWCETGLEPPATRQTVLRQTQARPDHSDSIVAVPDATASTAPVSCSLRPRLILLPLVANTLTAKPRPRFARPPHPSAVNN